MSREELLKDVFLEISHNLSCYSEDTLMTKPKKEYEDSWYKEKEKLELIEELLQEEKETSFKVNTSMCNLYEERDINFNVDLAYLDDRENGISCHIIVYEKDNENKLIYELILNIHKRDEFDDEYENVYSKIIPKETFKNRVTLKREMEKELKIFKNFIEADKKGARVYNNFYTKEGDT